MSLVFVINLARETERRKYITKHLVDCGIEQFTVVDAICGKTLSADTIAQRYSKKLNKKHYWHPLTREEIGCVLSHLSCYRQLLNTHQQGAFIFEDDMQCLNTDLAEAMCLIETNKLPSNAICLLHHIKVNHHHIEIDDNKAEKYQLARVSKPLNFMEEHAYLAHSYYIKRQTAEILLREFDKIYAPIDIWHMHCARLNIPLFFITPACTQQHVAGQLHSAIEADRHNIQTQHVLRCHIWIHKKALIHYVFCHVKKPFRLSLLKDIPIIIVKFIIFEFKFCRHLLTGYLKKYHPTLCHYLRTRIR